MSRLSIHEAAGAAFDIISATNGFVAEAAPWALAKDPQAAERLDAVLFEAAEAVRAAAVLLLPVMPASAAAILRRVGDTTPVADVRVDRDAAWRSAGERVVSGGPALWPRTDLDAAAAQGRAPTPAPPSQQETTVNDTTGGAAPAPPPAAAPQAAPPTDAPPAADAKIGIDDFMKVELRAAKVLAAEAVPKSKKLIRLSVDVGEPEPRTILAGIAEGYQPAELVGRMIAIVANLKPAKLMGIESSGMVLAASPEGGAPILVGVDERVPPGTRVR
jgi:methionyl-tRNA synthetase